MCAHSPAAANQSPHSGHSSVGAWCLESRFHADENNPPVLPASGGGGIRWGWGRGVVRPHSALVAPSAARPAAALAQAGAGRRSRNSSADVSNIYAAFRDSRALAQNAFPPSWKSVVYSPMEDADSSAPWQRYRPRHKMGHGSPCGDTKSVWMSSGHGAAE